MGKNKNHRQKQQNAISRTIAFMNGEQSDSQEIKPIHENALYKKESKKGQASIVQIVESEVTQPNLPEILPKDISDLDLAFATSVRDFMPAYNDIPDEFKRYSNPYAKLQSEWFFSGLKRSKIRVKPGIDENKALRHLTYIQRSFEPQHEHKAAGVAYLMSLWFDIV